MTHLKPITDQQLVELDKSAVIGDRLPEEGSILWLALRERLKFAEQLIEIREGFYEAMERDWKSSKASLAGLRQILHRLRSESSLWRTPKAGGQDKYAGLPPGRRLIDEALRICDTNVPESFTIFETPP